MHKSFRALLLYLTIALHALGQNDTLFFRHFTADHGLSQHNISSIIQDSLGFMWYGTHDGFNKFDGYKFIAYKHDPKNKNSLVSDDISCLAVEKSGMIWIGTRMKGINKYNPYTGIFTVFQNERNNPNTISSNVISSLFVDTIHQLLWIGTDKGLSALEFKTEKIVSFRHELGQKNGLSDNKITSVKMDKRGILWIGTENGGLNSFDYSGKIFTQYKYKEGDAKTISSNNIRDVFADRKNTVWVATANGLNSINTLTGELRTFKHDESNPNSISSNDLTSVYQDKYGKIWVGTANEGLCVYYPQTEKFYLYSHEKEVPNSLSSNKINTVSQGRSGMFWAGTSDGGLNAFNPKSLKFNLLNPISKNENVYEDITCIYIDEENNLLLGTKEKGLYLYNTESKVVLNCRPEKGNKTSVSGKAINCFYKDPEGNLLVGSDNGLDDFYCTSGKFSKMHFSEEHPYAKISCVIKDSDNLYWIGTKNEGAFTYDRSTNAVVHFDLPDGSNALTENSIKCIKQDTKGNIWIGTDGAGLIKYEKATGRKIIYRSDDTTQHNIGGNFINSIYEDSRGTIWISTWGGGLNAYRADKNNFSCFTISEGLPSNSLNAILEDKNKNLWVGTASGICRLTFTENKLTQCRIFDLVDGLPTVEFYESSACKNSMGRMFFTCKKGLIAFHPDSLKNNPYKPPVIITDFQLFNKSVLPNDSTGILQTSISVTKEITLNYNQNSFSFEFTAISFINPLKNKYAYKLDGFDKEWNYHNALNRSAAYTNLSPGTYTFTVKASNNDGIWNEKGTSVVIHIKAPFWQTWWFIGLIVLGAALIIYFIYNIKVQRIKAVEKMRSHIARDLHDDMGSTLSSISIYNEVVLKLTEEKVPEAVQILESMGESSRTAMENMNDIVWAINPKNEKLTNIIERIKIYSNQIMGAREIKFSMNITDSVGEIKLSMDQRKNLYLVLKEAINNAAKYSMAKDCVISIIKKDKFVEVEIKDNGVGLDDTHQSLGGNGMINMRKRVSELGGELMVFSEKQKGTLISFKFEPQI
ncbi:MAG: ligand-binding sensor domain-containing protein [Bacteroidia bacterium]